MQKIENLLLDTIVEIIERNEELVSIAVCQRAKFEGWLKFELVRCLKRSFPDASVEFSVENKSVDIHFDSAFVELKTPNTNYSNLCCESKTRPITKNVDGIIDDVKKLRDILPQTGNNNNTGYVAFIMFPLDEGKLYMEHVDRITKEIKHLDDGIEPKMKEVCLNGVIPLLVYVSRV